LRLAADGHSLLAMLADFRICLLLIAMISITAMLGFIVAPFYEAGIRVLGLAPEIQPSVCEDSDPCHTSGGNDA
jgi:hypothetical protein